MNEQGHVLKIIREKNDQHPLGYITKLVVSETGQLVRGVQSVKYEETVLDKPKLIIEVAICEVDIELGIKEADIVIVPSKKFGKVK